MNEPCRSLNEIEMAKVGAGGSFGRRVGESRCAKVVLRDGLFLLTAAMAGSQQEVTAS
jgi:hypothetical protein